MNTSCFHAFIGRSRSDLLRKLYVVNYKQGVFHDFKKKEFHGVLLFIFAFLVTKIFNFIKNTEIIVLSCTSGYKGQLVRNRATIQEKTTETSRKIKKKHGKKPMSKRVTIDYFGISKGSKYLQINAVV